jgi:hypothetical protein
VLFKPIIEDYGAMVEWKLKRKIECSGNGITKFRFSAKNSM